MKFSQFLATAAVASVASAHTTIYSILVNDVDQGLGNSAAGYIRTPPNNNPVKDVTSESMTCNVNNVATAKNVDVKAGDKISLQWHHNSNDPSDDIIAASHKGPVMAYIAPAASNGAGDVWVKLAQDGYDGTTWGVTNLIANKGKYDVTLPSTLADGEYLLRGEIIALHEGDTAYATNPARGAQFYMGCVQIAVSGGGTTALPAGVAIPGAYPPSDPGVVFNVYGSAATYPVPGPAVWDGTGSGAAPAPAPAPAPAAPGAPAAPAAPAPARPAPSSPARAPVAPAPAPTDAPGAPSYPAGPLPGEADAPASDLEPVKAPATYPAVPAGAGKGACKPKATPAPGVPNAGPKAAPKDAPNAGPKDAPASPNAAPNAGSNAAPKAAPNTGSNAGSNAAPDSPNAGPNAGSAAPAAPGKGPTKGACKNKGSAPAAGAAGGPTTLSKVALAYPAATGGASAAVAKYQQCGGSTYTGSTTCAEGSTCNMYNQYYSQCI